MPAAAAESFSLERTPNSKAGRNACGVKDHNQLGRTQVASILIRNPLWLVAKTFEKPSNRRIVTLELEKSPENAGYLA